MTSNGTGSGTQAVDRAARLLSIVVQADAPVAFADLVEETGLARSTASRLLTALESHYLLERDGIGGYVSGALFALYAARHDPWSQVARLAEPTLRVVGAKTRETVNLAIPRGDTVVQIAQVDASYVLGARDWTAVTVPPHCSALGKVLYAYDALEVSGDDLEQMTERSHASASTLAEELETVRRQGYAVASEELEVGLDAVAVPVRGLRGHVVAAIGVSGPSARRTAR